MNRSTPYTDDADAYQDDLRAAFARVDTSLAPPVGLEDRLHAAVARPRAAPHGERTGGIVGPARVVGFARAGSGNGTGHRSLLTAATATAAVVLAVGVAFWSGHAATTPGAQTTVVPWDGQGWSPSDTLAPTADDRSTSPTNERTVRACSADDLDLASSISRAQTNGWMATDVTLRASGTTPCSLQRGQAVEASLVDSSGRSLPVDGLFTGSGGGMSRWDESVAPGTLVIVTVSWAVVEGEAARPDAIVLRPDSTSAQSSSTEHSVAPLRVPLEGVVIPPHPEEPTWNSGYPWRSTISAALSRVVDAGSLASLSATVSAPTTVENGERIASVLHLTNPTDSPVSLSSCPDLRLLLSVVPLKLPVTIGAHGPLNCASAPTSIAPLADLDVDLQLDVSGLPLGDGWLTVQVVGSDGEVVQTRAAVTVA